MVKLIIQRGLEDFKNIQDYMILAKKKMLLKHMQNCKYSTFL